MPAFNDRFHQFGNRRKQRHQAAALYSNLLAHNASFGSAAVTLGSVGQVQLDNCGAAPPQGSFEPILQYSKR